MAECPSVCEHLHLPIQSGDDAVLRRMGRQYTVAHYLERLYRIRSAVPGIAVSTDIIVGFCGETDAQFEATLDVMRSVRYDQVFAAAFSARPGTPATHLADDVPPAEKRRRLNELLAVQEAIGAERNAAWIGRETEVLVDTIVPPRSHDHEPEPEHLHVPGAEAAGEGSPGSAGPDARSNQVRLAGRNREHKLVHVAGSAALLGRLVRVRIHHAGSYSLRGELV